MIIGSTDHHDEESYHDLPPTKYPIYEYQSGFNLISNFISVSSITISRNQDVRTRNNGHSTVEGRNKNKKIGHPAP